MLELINTLNELTTNAREYQKAVYLNYAPFRRRGRITPSLVRAWYYIPALDLVAASRFIGYKGMNRECYEQSTEIDGRVTEPHLQRKGWFRPLGEGEPQYEHARSTAKGLSPTCRLYPYARFYVLKNVYDKQINKSL